LSKVELQPQRHCIPKDSRVVAKSILGGLHHEYKLQKSLHDSDCAISPKSLRTRFFAEHKREKKFDHCEFRLSMPSA